MMSTHRVVEVCRGTGCEVATYCHEYRWVPKNEGYAVKEWMPLSPGENCPDFKIKQKHRWSDGDD